MAFEMIEKYRIYHCESTDIKKVTDIEEGSFLFETNTGYKYIFNGTSWVYFPESIQISDGINNAGIMMADGDYGLITITPGHVSTLNSYNSTLASEATFTGSAEDVVNHGIISCIITSDQDSATDGFLIEFSVDGITFIDGDNYTIYAGDAKVFSFQCAAQYFRISYTNGAGGIANVTLQTILKPYYVKPSSHRIGDVISPEDDSELVKAALTAQNVYNNLFVPIKASRSNNLQIADAENSLAIAKGEVDGSSVEEKFGNAPNFGTANGIVNMWDGADDGQAWELMQYVFSTTESIDSISSSEIADTQEITIEGLDINGNPVIQSKNLNGRNRVALDTNLYRVNRAYNSNSTKFTGHVIVYEDTPLTLGVPTLKTKIRAVIKPENQQTEMSVYTVPLGSTAYMQSLYASVSGASKDSNYVIILQTREPTGVFRTKYKTSLSDTGTSELAHDYKVPKKILQLTDVVLTIQMTAVGGSGASVSGGFEMILNENL